MPPMSALISVKLALQPETRTTPQEHGYGLVLHTLLTYQLLLGTQSAYPQRDGSG